jgi:hypothetical protein
MSPSTTYSVLLARISPSDTSTPKVLENFVEGRIAPIKYFNAAAVPRVVVMPRCCYRWLGWSGGGRCCCCATASGCGGCVVAAVAAAAVARVVVVVLRLLLVQPLPLLVGWWCCCCCAR